MKISVCMATYNGEKFIYKQIESILRQLKDNDEVIISDDSSNDHTVEIIKSFKDSRIILYEKNTYKSAIYNMENALKRARGDFIFLSDQDDIWVIRKVKTVSALLDAYDMVVSDCCIIDKHDKLLFDSFFRFRKSHAGLLYNLYKNCYIGCCMAFKRWVLDKALPFPKNIPMHDWWIGLIGELFGKTYFLEEKLVKYRRHGQNVTPTFQSSGHSVIRKTVSRCVLITDLIKLWCEQKKRRDVS